MHDDPDLRGRGRHQAGLRGRVALALLPRGRLSLPAWLDLARRPGPGANLAWLEGGLLVDAGSGTRAGVAVTDAWLAGRPLGTVALTHFHPDHCGGAGWRQASGSQVVAHEAEAALVNARDPRSCDTAWLGFGCAPFSVDRAVRDGDVVRAGSGGRELVAVHTPGQTPGHTAWWEPGDRVVFTGDLLQAGDVGWVPFGGPWADGALERTIAAVERLGGLGARIVIPGHGPPVLDVPRAVEESLARYAAWREDPEAMVRHAGRRALVTAVMMAPRTAAGLAALPWAVDLAARRGIAAEDVVAELLELLERRGAVAAGAGGVWSSPLEHEPPSPLWREPGRPEDWPPLA